MAAALLEGAAREPAPARGRPHRHARPHRGATRLGPEGPARARDPLHARARAAPGLHRRARRRRPGGHARGDAAPGRRSGPHQPAPARGPGDRPLGAGRRLRLPGRLPHERRPRVRPQPRALCVPALGPAGLSQLPRGPARHRHRAPGEPRVPRPGRVPRGRGRRTARLPRHRPRHRLPHHHGERPRRGRLGGGRDRGRGGDARPADGDAHPAGPRLPPPRPARPRRDGDRCRAHRDADAPQEGRGRQVRRVLRAGAREPRGRRSHDHRQHGARVRRHDRVLPGG